MQYRILSSFYLKKITLHTFRYFYKLIKNLNVLRTTFLIYFKFFKIGTLMKKRLFRSVE